MSERYAISEATVRLFGVDLVVCHLNTGERVITEDSLAALFEAMEQPGFELANFDEALLAVRELLA